MTGGDDILATVLPFLQAIGLDAVATDLEAETFLPGLKVDRGRILYDPSRLAYPGDLLHEAGHIAVVPPGERAALSDDLPAEGGAEMAAIAWSYAAALHLGLDPADVIHGGSNAYRGEAETIVENFSQGRYFGVPVLAWRGMTVEPHRAEPGGPPPYPAMSRWVCGPPDPAEARPQTEAPAPPADDDAPAAETSPAAATAGPESPKKPPKLRLAPFTGSQREARERFAALAGALLSDRGDPGDFRAAGNDLYALFNEIGGRPQDLIGVEAFTWQQESLLPAGKAINPYTAATCLLDYARTRAFARGVREAIEAARLHRPGERIEVLYAGTGPYAPLAFLQTAFFGPEAVGFTLIDMHEAALACLRQVVTVLGLEDYLDDVVQADATQWAPPGGWKYDVAIAEVMQRALIVEPQVGVTLAVSRHLRPQGILVPERIALSLCLLDSGAERRFAAEGSAKLAEYFRLSGDSVAAASGTVPEPAPVAHRKRIMIAEPFTLTRSLAETCTPGDSGRIVLPDVRLPERIPPGYGLRVLTRITTYGDNILGDYDSGLTFPEPLLEEPALTPGGRYALWYETQGVPGLRMRAAE